MNGKQMSVMRKFMFIRNYLTFDSYSLKRWCKLESWGKCVYFFSSCLFDLELVPAQRNAFFIWNVMTVCMFEQQIRSQSFHCMIYAAVNQGGGPSEHVTRAVGEAIETVCWYLGISIQSDFHTPWRPVGMQ